MKGVLTPLCLILVAPLALVDVPPLLDYPNHLARAFVLAFGPGDPILSRMYAAHWAIIPDLGIDLVLPPLLHVLPVHVAGRAVIAMAVLLPVVGTVAYSRAVFRTRSLWPLASVLVAYNGTLLLGFLNFVAGIGLALLLAAAWMEWRERFTWRVVGLAIIGATALFFCHLMSLVFCTILIGGHELEWLWAHRHKPGPMTKRGLIAVVPLVLPLTLYTQSPLSPVATGIEWPTFDNKLRELVMPFANYVLPLDIMTACLVVGYLLFCALRGRCRITSASGTALILTALLFVISPNGLKGTYLFDTRFIIMLGFLLFGAVLPMAQPRAVAALLAVLFVVRMVVLDYAWLEQRQDLADLRVTIASVQPGARVFLAFARRKDEPMSQRLSVGLPTYEHLPALLLIEHRAFWPYLFDDPSQQPIEVLTPYRELQERMGGFVNYRELTKIDLCGYDDLLLIGPLASSDPPTPWTWVSQALSTPGHQYILVAGSRPGMTEETMETRFALRAQSAFAALFQINRAECAPATDEEPH